MQDTNLDVSNNENTAIYPTEPMLDADFIAEDMQRPTPEQMKQFMQLMNRHKPGKEAQKAKAKATNRKKAKMQRASKKKNRK